MSHFFFKRYPVFSFGDELHVFNTKFGNTATPKCSKDTHKRPYW